MKKKYIKLSKFLSYILRHHPEKYGLSMNAKGFVSLEEIENCLKRTKHSWAGIKDIKKLIRDGNKKRFQIKNDKIRALYGHSIEVKIKGNKIQPPPTLYHGTSPENLENIENEGIRPMGRQFVHLAKSKKEARKIGSRHNSKPIILKINALEAYKKGIEFFDRGEVILCKKIPPQWINILE